jgi:hypothetical protein
MNLEDMDSLFQRLRDQEMDYSERVSFEEVMERRKKKKRAFVWWRRSLAILAGLGLVGFAVYYVQPKNSQPNAANNYTLANSNKDRVGENAVNSNNKIAAQLNTNSNSAKSNSSSANFKLDNEKGVAANKYNESASNNAQKSLNPLVSNKSSVEKRVQPKKRQVRNILAESMAIREQLIQPESKRAKQFQELAENPSGVSLSSSSAIASNNGDLRMESAKNSNQNSQENRNSFGTADQNAESASNALEAENHVFGELAQSSPENTEIDRFGGVTDASQNYGFAWATWMLSSARLCYTPIDWNKNNWDIEGIEFEIPEQRIRNKFQKLPWFFEVSAIAASNNTINFDEDRPLSVLGTQYLAQYSATFLKEFNNATMWGLGMQYSEWVGNGQCRENEFVKVMKLDTQVRSITLPGLPKRYYTVVDTSYQTVNNSRTGLISYKINKVALPISYRFHVQMFKVPVQIGMNLAPGITTVSEGTYFTETSFNTIEKKRHTTMDGKLFVGPMIPVTRNMTLVIQPSVMYQSFINDRSQVNGKFFGGLGVSMIWKIK